MSLPRFLAIVLLSLGIGPALAQEAGPRLVVGYYPSWAEVLPVDQVNFHGLTHLIHAFATIRKGALHPEDNLPSPALTRAAHVAGVRVLLSLGGADSGAEFSALTHDSAAEDAFIRSLVKLACDNGYDGVDVDWEFPAASDQEQVVAFVSKLRQALRERNPRALVTMPLPADNYYGQYFDAARLAPLVDFVMVMTYDVHGPWKEGKNFSHAGFNSPLNETESDRVDGREHSFQKSIDYWRSRGFPDRQLLAGIPFFGHGFMVKNWGDVPRKASGHAELDYRATQALLAQGWIRQWDAQAGVPWLQSPEGQASELISYDDPQSVELKARWARDAGLRGIFFWEISEDFIQGRNVLVEAALKGFAH